MKKQFAWLLMLACILLVGCSDGDEVFYETNDDLLNKNGIADVAIVFQKFEVEEKTKVLYYGIRQGKDWFALFDVASGNFEKDWYGKARDYVRPPEGPYPAIDIILGYSLGNGDYAVTCRYDMESTRQLVRLSDRSDAEYGFTSDSETIIRALPGNRFVVRTNGNDQIWNFDGGVFAEDVWIRQLNSPFTGFQNGKLWVGYTDKEGNFHEAVTDEPIERNRRIHLGYDEYAEFYIKQVGIGASVKTDWGYAFLPIYWTDGGGYGSFDLFLINGGKVVFLPMIQRGDALRSWYKESLLVYNDRGGEYYPQVVSPEGKIIATFKSNGVSEKVEPVSYEEGIGFYGDRFCRTNFVSGKAVWNVYIDKLDTFASDAKKTITPVKKEGVLWFYRCDIVNKDGSKDRFDFKLDVEAGKIIY